MTMAITPAGDPLTFETGLQTARRLDPDVVTAGYDLKNAAAAIDRLQTLWMPRNAEERRRQIAIAKAALKTLEKMP